MWTRKLTVIDGTTSPGDYLIYRYRQVVGRVHPRELNPNAPAYGWGTYTWPSAGGGADSLEEACERLREAIRSHWDDSVPEVPRPGTKYHDL